MEPVAAGAVLGEQDEDKILEALIREEEQATLESAALVEGEVSDGFSVEDLASFTLVEVELPVDDDDQEVGSSEGDLDFVPTMSVLTPDAGKIRFAEDIVDESRGSGRRAW